MTEELTNLLPQERQHALMHDYRLRLGTVVLALIILLMLAAALLLLPTYVFLTGSANAKDAHLTSVRSALSSSDQVALTARLAALSTSATALIALADRPAVTKIIGSILAISRPGVTLSGFTYTPAEGKNLNTLSVTGMAATRDALRGYQLALGGAPSVRSANLPVSAYAKDANIDFTITLTITP
jgi:hypothetical protein